MDESGISTPEKLFEEVKLNVGLELERIGQDVPLLGVCLEREVKETLSQFAPDENPEVDKVKAVLTQLGSMVVDCSDYQKAAAWLEKRIGQAESDLENPVERVRSKLVHHNKDAGEFERTIRQIDDLRWSRTLAQAALEQTSEFLKTGKTDKVRLVAMMESYTSDGDDFDVRALCPSCTQESKVSGDQRPGVEQGMQSPRFCACGDCAFTLGLTFMKDDALARATNYMEPTEEQPVTLFPKELSDEAKLLGRRDSGQCLIVAAFHQ